MKKQLSIFLPLLLLVAVTTLALLKWDTWFHNPSETTYTYTSVPDRIVLLAGEDLLHSRTLTWRCDTTLRAHSYVEYIAGDTLHAAAQGRVINTEGGKSAHYRAQLNNLQPNATYPYRIRCGNSYSPWYTFTVKERGNDPLTFLYLGDIQDTLGGVTAHDFEQIDRLFPHVDFWAFGGDVIQRPLDCYWDYWYKSMGEVTHTTPIVATAGNHEYRKGLTPQLDPRWVTTFAPVDRTYYHLTTDSLCFIVLDTNRSLYAQYHWLKTVLKEAQQPWRVVMYHHPIYAVKRGRSGNMLVRWLFQPLFEQYGVQLVLQGHDHGYGRAMTQQQGGGAAAPIYIVSSCSPKSYAVGNSDRFVRVGEGMKLVQQVEIAPDTLTYSAYTLDGALYDRVQITPEGSVVDYFSESTGKLR